MGILKDVMVRDTGSGTPSIIDSLPPCNVSVMRDDETKKQKNGFGRWDVGSNTSGKERV